MDELTHYWILKKLIRGVIDDDEYEKLTVFGDSDGGGSSDSKTGKEKSSKEQEKFEGKRVN